MRSAIDPQNFMADPNARPFILDFRCDLLAPDIEIEATGRYFIFKHRIDKGQIMIVKAVVPYAMERTAVGTSGEDYSLIDPNSANGSFSFEPKINGNAPFISSINFNSPRISTGTLTNGDRTRRNGLSHISANPLGDAQKAWYNPMFTFIVPADAVLSVVFTILPQGTVSPMQMPYTIGLKAEHRVDFAGTVISGLVMPEQSYYQMVKDFQDSFKK